MMKIKGRQALLIALSLILLGSSWTQTYAQSADNKYFSETGHNVSGEFLKVYNKNINATFLYGYPITEEFTSKDGKRVQYFQRARFEYRADLPEGQRVQMTALGSLTFVSTGKLDAGNTFACRKYAETGNEICFAFLEFFDKYGGVNQFGYPISGFEYHEDKLVQYFEKARLEWQPWKPEGQRVVVADLGRVYFDKLGEDPALIPPVKPLDNTIQAALSLRIRAFAWKAVTLTSDSQSIFIIAQDQNMRAIANASCTTVVHWADRRADSYATTTNINGVSIVALTFKDQPHGSLVYADVACVYSNLKGSSTTSFRIWY